MNGAALWRLSCAGLQGTLRVSLLPLALSSLSAGVASCDAGQPALSGIGEPIEVVGGQFIAGDLPKGAGGPAVTSVSLNSQVVIPGAAGKAVSGRAKETASAVATRFADMGSGYWVVPVAELDAMFPGELNFRFSANFDADNPPGFHPLRFVAIDGAGHAGDSTELPLCIADRIPDNLHGCEPNVPPPAAVITLRWDTNFDVDLHVVMPNGTDVNPKSPLSAPIEAGAAPDPNSPHIDRDSLGGCVPDGLRQEDLVFQKPPPPGAYQVLADPFAACGQSAVRFELTVYRRDGSCPACALDPVFTQAGELLGSQVTGGAAQGLFVAQVSL
jgi:hypothetical protein